MRFISADIFDVVSSIDADLAYYDPPYGSNNDKMPPSRVRYASYYHLWSSICLFDNPPLFGKAKRRADTSDVLSASVFEEFRKNDAGRFIVVEAIERLLRADEAPSHHLVVQFRRSGNGRRAERSDSRCGKTVEVIEVDYKRNVMGGMRWTHEWVRDAEEAQPRVPVSD